MCVVEYEFGNVNFLWIYEFNFCIFFEVFIDLGLKFYILIVFSYEGVYLRILRRGIWMVL